MPNFDNGVLYFGHSAGDLALTVRFGVIVASDPVREWAIGRAAADVWSDALLYGAEIGTSLRWEGEECPSEEVTTSKS